MPVKESNDVVLFYLCGSVVFLVVFMCGKHCYPKSGCSKLYVMKTAVA